MNINDSMGCNWKAESFDSQNVLEPKMGQTHNNCDKIDDPE